MAQSNNSQESPRSLVRIKVENLPVIVIRVRVEEGVKRCICR